MNEEFEEWCKTSFAGIVSGGEASFRAGWNAAIEKAAKECEELAEDFAQYKEHKYDMKQLGATECAEAIRALKEE
jgi:hypothetical protein